jgi:hypothetical protein
MGEWGTQPRFNGGSARIFTALFVAHYCDGPSSSTIPLTAMNGLNAILQVKRAA